jgi:mycothiol synthase
MMNSKEMIMNEVELSLESKVPGLFLRGFSGKGDYANILKVINASKVADNLERSDTLENIKLYYEHLHNSDPYKDMLFAEVDGEVIAYSRVEWNLNDDGEWLGFHLCFLHPKYRRKGIGRLISRYDENRLRQIAEELLEADKIQTSTPRYFEVVSSDSEVGKEALMLSEGYQPVRYAFSMQRSLLEPIEVSPMPPGLEIRPSLPEHYRTIWDASQEAFQDHWGYIPAPEEEYQKWLKEPIFNPHLWKIAWDGNQVAGMVLNFIDEKENQEYNRKRGYTEGISVRRPWRRRGLARALLTRSMKMFKDMGMTEAALGVDTQNLSGALRLYESVGFHPYKRYTTFRKPLQLTEE